MSWGTDDTDSIQRALDLAKETGVSVYIPPGHYLITKTLNYLTLKAEDDLSKPDIHVSLDETWTTDVRSRSKGELYP